MIKKISKSIISRLGYAIANKNYKDIFTIRHSMGDAFAHLKQCGFYPELIIDAGAANGTPELQSSFPDSTFFWIEPLVEFENELKDLKNKFKGDYIITAVGNETGELTIYVQDDKVGSSILSDHENVDIKKQARPIKVVTLKEIADKRFQQFKKILLKVDVQGYELEVLEGAKEFLNNIDVIILEVSLFKFYPNWPEFYEVIDYMKKRSFVVFDIVGGINRPLDHSLAQKDIVFVKENGLLRTSHNWEK